DGRTASCVGRMPRIARSAWRRNTTSSHSRSGHIWERFTGRKAGGQMVEAKPDSSETLRLLERIQVGECEAFEELFARHRPWLRHLVALRLDPQLRARLDPSDVVQEAHLEAFRRLSDFLGRRPMPFRLWLRKTLMERLRMLERQHLEASRRAVGRELPLPDSSSVPLAQQLAGTDPTPSQQLAQHELAQQVQAALAQLLDLDREILFMRTFE